MGVLHRKERPTFDAQMNQQVQDVIMDKGPGDMQALLTGRETWVVG